MPNRSTFIAPNYTVDTFEELFNLPPSKVKESIRLKELMIKENKSSQEITEMNNLTILLKSYLITPEKWNKFCDCLINMESFMKNNVEGYVYNKQNEINKFIVNKQDEINKFITQQTNEVNTLITNKTNEINKFTSTKKKEVIDFVNQKDAEITDKKNYFINLVNQKELQLAEMDSKVKRHWQKWNAKTNGQIEYDIFIDGINLNLLQEAILNIETENIDLTINGIPQVPYEDFDIKNDGTYRKIILKSNAKDLIVAGTEVMIKYYKNMGKLYFKHSSSHQEGGHDQITVTEGMLNEDIKTKMLNVVGEKNMPNKRFNGLVWFNII